MITCSSPGCDAPAVLQWQRAATDAEAVAWRAAAVASQQNLVDYQRGQARLELVELRQRLERVQAAADAGDLDAVSVLPLAAAAVDGAQARLDGIADAEPVEGGDVVIPVFGCEVHEIGAEQAAVLHEPACVAGGCDCKTP